MTSYTPAWKTWDQPAEGDTLRSWQAGRCAWCGDEDDTERLVRDHCHMTGLVRGLLCKGCNIREGVSYDPTWIGWREGDNTANAIKHYEIYENHMGHTAISLQSTLSYYSYSEREAYFEAVVAQLTAGEIEWPEEAPWIESAIQRKVAAEQQLHDAMKSLTFGAPPADEAATA